MALTLSNQRPIVLDPVHLIPIAGDYDPIKALSETVIKPLLTPLAGASASVTDAAGNDLDEDDLVQLHLRVLQDTVDTSAEADVKSLLGQGLVSYDAATPLPAAEMFSVQAATRAKPALPHPSPVTLYTAATDVVPAAKKLLSGYSLAAEDEFLVALDYTYAPATLGFWFQSEAAFTDFAAWAQSIISPLIAASVLSSDTQALLSKFSSITLNVLTEGLVLRKDANDQNEPYSFARIVVNLLMRYQNEQRKAGIEPTMGVLPFHLGELFIPQTLILVNLEIHARANPPKVDNEWRLINATLSSGVRVVSNRALSKLTALPRAMAKAASAAASAASNKHAVKGRSASISFRKRPPTSMDLSKGVIRALRRMKEVNRSRNIFKKTRTTFLKASRRDPDDFNRPGRITSTHYLPDLHVYVDTSGSISEENYQDTVRMLIVMAKKMNVNLYFSSFSNILSQETLLQTSNKSLARIWQEFRRIPKVSGGTDYRQIWEYINASPARKARFSLVITDFEWYPPTQRVEHPKNLYYAPIAVPASSWPHVMRWAKEYTSSMAHIEPAIAQRMIGTVV